ncbi:IS110 family transposase [Saccharolobus solfataricus]|uniref:IS110 family transposase n=2 Tax=Saccharolobus solfataricus TaxID=2287 RepID=A0A3G8ECZ5_SACSO|nr:IS110 family transposase [Saccharolobus solfataricus]AZF69104.1 IS110 family transposase [Saccharolobus solfataricus]AZF71724.1 IS110 family transposase [Saccharolobus solfataricus]AZF74344.1 IS110 family transposase [Saccharolobus solfataricus]AZF76967.1 IS110 family transposase [Saccharolobus solfataricus]AZF79572.1 IS110 family transposase [Saccharolobus solfataricus]
MVEWEIEAKSSGTGVTSPYRRTEHCENTHEYRCDTSVGVIGIDVSKEHLVTSKGRVRKFTNNEKGYEEILTMKPNIIVIEPTGVYSTRPCQYFKERGVKVLLVSLAMERKGRKGKKTDFYDAEKLENMVNKSREYVNNPLKELVSLYLFMKDVQTKQENRLRRALFLVSDEEKLSEERLEKFSKGDFSDVKLYQLEYTGTVLREIQVLARTLIQTREELKEVRKMIEGNVPQDHVLLTISGIGKLAAGIIIGIVGDIRRFPRPESFVAYCGLDPVVERSGRIEVRKGISKRGNKYLRSLFYFLAETQYSRNPTLLKLHEAHKDKLKGRKLYTALARKLARIVWSVWYNNKPYEVK